MTTDGGASGGWWTQSPFWQKAIIILIGAIAGLIALGMILNAFSSGSEEAAGTTAVPGASSTSSTQAASTTASPSTTTTASTTTTTTSSTTTTTTTTLPTFAPIVIEGSGNDVVDIEKPEDAAIVVVTGNSAGRYFGVTAYDSNNERIGNLVNTTDPYEGTRPLDWLDGEWTARFEVEAEGAWEIRVLPLSETRTASAPGTISGNGDDVFVVVDGFFDTALVNGNPEGRYFGVTAYGSSGRDNLVNTTDPFDGRVIVPTGAIAFEVEGSSSGDWMITFE